MLVVTHFREYLIWEIAVTHNRLRHLVVQNQLETKDLYAKLQAFPFKKMQMARRQFVFKKISSNQMKVEILKFLEIHLSVTGNNRQV